MNMQKSLGETAAEVTGRTSFRRRLVHDDDFPANLAEMLWRGDADRLLFSSYPLQIKDRCAVARHEDSGPPLLVKRHTWGGFWRTIRLSWRESSARRCARLGWQLAVQGIPTPRPRAYLENCLGPFGYRSYLITDYVEGTDLYRFVRYGSPSTSELRWVARQVADIWQRLADLGISHNDTKPENYIVDPELRVWLIDFEKSRLGGKAKRQRQRQIADVKNFLHIRGWHRQAAAREIFLDEFLRKPLGQELQDSIAAPRQEVDANLCVSILCGDDRASSFVVKAIDSVRDLADEINVIARAESGRHTVVERLEPCGAVEAPPEWMLVLHADELVTPFLAKELQQRITAPNAADAFRVPIARQLFGRNMPDVGGGEGSPIRLFRRDRCSYSLAGGRVTISADPEQTEELTGKIEKCISPTITSFIDGMNARTTTAARRRYLEGQRPRLAKAMMRSLRQFVHLLIWEGRIRAGWSGLAASFLQAAFTWLEEAKLRELTRSFADDATGAERQALADTERPSAVRRAKAA
jgi:hypothetical protein